MTALKSTIKSILKQGRDGTRAAMARAGVGRPPRFAGAWPDRAGVLAALDASEVKGYDDPGVAEVSFPQMCRREVWDYPVILWLDRWLAGGGRVLDAGGHMGTKFMAFREVLDLGAARWTVYDMPGIVTAARARQAEGVVPAEVGFVDDIADLPATDILLASGLLQYLDLPLAALLQALPVPPAHVILNKVALRDGPAVFTAERIGPTRVPYQIRSRDTFEAELAALGYRIADRWQIHDLGHVIPTHPQLGRSESWGFALTQDR
ncbi:methyltransferase, TIGR04325 family [Jannaschia sp. M317]|uniref:methyltransferase, TIGR04325 family n=1 Tax=Jannaschia sp. M317 TaxID=2867011 RepID=UPI0021A8883D|nr:methyltransferase, TIGR04325 family [Jannaschia sp. M317]UWQ19948.1 methyltransferase, TIGR04325 family [Jannaschia sp. M317]